MEANNRFRPYDWPKPEVWHICTRNLMLLATCYAPEATARYQTTKGQLVATYDPARGAREGKRKASREEVSDLTGL